jgi:Tol biopolymer transport system component
VETSNTRRPAWIVGLLGAATAVLILAQARAEPVGAHVVAEDVVLGVDRANLSTQGAEAEGSTFGAALSASGRFVAFTSAATSLVPGDRNGKNDVFVRDLVRRRTWRASVSSSGAESDGHSKKPSISADGSVVAFPSSATNLVPGDRNGVPDVFVRDHVAGLTTRMSAGNEGEADALSLAALVSANGRTILFSSDASNLVPADDNGAMDVFVRDRVAGGISRVSVGPFGESASRSEASSIDARGHVVAFRSYAPNLVYGDRNGKADVFVFDRRTALMERVNVSSTGAEARAATFRGVISGDGRFVGFRSRAGNLVPGDTNKALDAFVHDRWTGVTTRISVASDGKEADAGGFDRPTRRNFFMSRPFLSEDGRYAAFTSRASNLVPDDRNGVSDVFVHDLLTGTTARVSVSADGNEADAPSFVSGISADGRVVAFTSVADNVVAGDTNGRRDVFVASLRLPGVVAGSGRR